MLRAIWAVTSALAIGLAGCAHERAASSGATAAQAESASVASAHDPAGLIGIRWQWVRTITPVERIEVRKPERYTLRLLPDGNAEMRFDCNRGGGTYAITGNRLVFGPLMSTRMACPPGSQDAIFMKQLDQVTTFFLQEGRLFLEMPLDSGTMHFERAADQD
jgi:heat shock protein HslJ